MASSSKDYPRLDRGIFERRAGRGKHHRRASAVFIYSADTPLAAEHAVVDAVLVDAVAKAGGAHGERH